MGNQPVEDYQIVSPKLTVKAMRDSGYKNTAYALAELIDNSIDAEANLVEVFACESTAVVTKRARSRIDRIAVIDNGSGMDSEALRRALKYGDGLGDTRQRIGRFGMGLPNSSMSQCTRVEVWSWQNGPGNALYSYLDLNEILNGQSVVPEPVAKRVPSEWRSLSEGLSQSGTLVLWSKLDRVQWFGAASTLRNTEQLIGRMYRHFIYADKLRIRLVPVREGEILEGTRDALPNDPLYLMSPSSTPSPFDDVEMFEPFALGESKPGYQPFFIDVNGKQETVVIRASISRESARLPSATGAAWPPGTENMDPGKLPWGKHAGKNVGVSVVRKGRELELDPDWANPETTERWWGIEIDFPPSLDEVFGVTNNKQSASIFATLSGFDWTLEREGDESFAEYKERLRDSGDPRLPLIDLAIHLQTKVLGAIRRKAKGQRAGTRSGSAASDSTLEKATDAVNRRREEGFEGTTDKLDKESSEEEQREEQVRVLVDKHHVEPVEAEKLVDEGQKLKLKARWLPGPLDSPAFFSIDLMAAMLQVIFNTEHPAYDRLMALLEETPSDATLDDLKKRLALASETFKLLLFSWARFEDEIPDGRARERVSQARQDWGRYARDFLTDDHDEA